MFFFIATEKIPSKIDTIITAIDKYVFTIILSVRSNVRINDFHTGLPGGFFGLDFVIN